jgi:hypothetical protein
MNQMNAILLCKAAREPCWQLPPPPSGTLGLIGWRLAQQEVDAGVPEDVASLLTRALTAVAWVTFPSSSEPTSSVETVVRPLEPAGVKERLDTVLSRAPSKFFLVSTRRPEVARSLFDDPAFPWWLQGQMVILTPADGPTPNLDRRSLLAMMNEAQWPAHETASAVGISALVRPGVDGDVVGIVASTEGFDQVLWDSIQREAARSSFTCEITTENQFTALLAETGNG